MELNVQRRIAAQVLKCSPKRIVFDSTKLKEIKEAITKADIRGLVIDGLIKKKRIRGISNSRSKQIKIQKSKGKRKGHGSRKGKRTARTPRKRSWINRVRLQRRVLKGLKKSNAIENNVYWELYKKIKGGFFRSKRHLQLYIAEKHLSGEKGASPKAEKQKPEMKKTEKAAKTPAKAKK